MLRQGKNSPHIIRDMHSTYMYMKVDLVLIRLLSKPFCYYRSGFELNSGCNLRNCSSHHYRVLSYPSARVGDSLIVTTYHKQLLFELLLTAEKKGTGVLQTHFPLMNVKSN